MNLFRIKVADPHGFCSGVRRAITLTERALTGIKPVYLLHELVHNHAVSARFTAKGAVIVNTIDEVPDNTVVVTSAHGIPAETAAEIRRRGLQWVDATCPIVQRIHENCKAVGEGALIILIGHRGHPETVGTLGQMPGKIYLIENTADVAKLPDRVPGQEVRILTQTTLSAAELEGPLAALEKRYGACAGGDCRCYATTERQTAVKALAAECDCIFIVGSRHSSNSCRLREVAEAAGVRAYLVDDPENFDISLLRNCRTVGVSSGASVPERQLEELVNILEKNGGCR